MMASTPGQLLARDEVVAVLRQSLSSTEHGLGTVPNAIKVVIRDDMWRERQLKQTGELVKFASFAAFVTTPPLKGLGATLDQLRGVCRDDPEALDAIDRATQNAPALHTGAGNNVPSRPEGNTSAKALRRLRKDRPDLHAEVLAGIRSPHGAMLEAGFRQRTIAIPVGRPDAAAAALKRHLSRDEYQRLARRLLSEDA